MPEHTELDPDGLIRIPGLYRRWELAELLTHHSTYRIEKAGTHQDGTALVAVYIGGGNTQEDHDCIAAQVGRSVSGTRKQASPPGEQARKGAFPPMSRAPLTPTSSKPLTETSFRTWIAQGRPGDRLEYHRGFLIIDTAPAVSRLPQADRDRVERLAAVAWRACEAGLVHLVQQRLGPDRFVYIAIIRSQPGTRPVSPRQLLADLEGV